MEGHSCTKLKPLKSHHDIIELPVEDEVHCDHKRALRAWRSW